MSYMIIPLKNKRESNLLALLLEKMQIKTVIYSDKEMEEIGLMAAMKEAEQSGEGDMEKVMKHLYKVTR